MSVPPGDLRASKRKLRKFLDRAVPELGEPIVALRCERGYIPVAELTWTATDEGNWQLTGVDTPGLDKRMVDSTLVECQVFFAQGEDCYLPGVVNALLAHLTDEQREARKPLKDAVASVVAGSRIGASGPIFHSGRLETDIGLGPGKLVGSDQLAMDYIYGVALHEDDDKRERVLNVGMSSALEAVMYHFDELLRVIEYVRAQLENDIAKGYLTLDDE